VNKRLSKLAGAVVGTFGPVNPSLCGKSIPEVKRHSVRTSFRRNCNEDPLVVSMVITRARYCVDAIAGQPAVTQTNPSRPLCGMRLQLQEDS
jgi:hypothetical protein